MHVMTEYHQSMSIITNIKKHLSIFISLYNMYEALFSLKGWT